MPPRASTKVKRGPELWNAKKKNCNTDCVAAGDDVALDGSSGTRPKYPPGPDMVAAVTEEFRNLPQTKSSTTLRSPSQLGAVPSNIPTSDKSGGKSR